MSLLKTLRSENTFGFGKPNLNAIRSNMKGEIKSITDCIKFNGTLRVGKGGYCFIWKDEKNNTHCLSGYGKQYPGQVELIRLIEKRLNKTLNKVSV